MDKRIATVLLIILLVGTLLRTVPVRNGHHYWDETVYLQHGEIIAGDRPADTYHEFDIRPPLISLLAGAVFAAGGSVPMLHIILALIAAAGIPLVYLLGKTLYRPDVGLIAAAGFAISPTHVYFSHLISIDPVLPVLWTASALTWLYSWRRDTPGWALVSGGLAGIAALAKFTALVLPFALLTAAVIVRLDGTLTVAKIQGAVRRTLLDGRSWLAGIGTAAVFGPYLVWQLLTYGDPLYVFRHALMVVNAETPFLTYISGMHELLPYAFLTGLVLFLPRLRHWHRARIIYPVVVFLALFVPLQFLITNREVRYLLPVIGMIAVMAAAGFRKIRLAGSGQYTAVAVFAVLIAAQPVIAHDYGQMLQDGRWTYADQPTAAHEAAGWLAANTAENTTVYTNDRWPIIAYYSERRVRIVPAGNSEASWAAVDAVEKPGYIVFVEDGADWGGPEQYLLKYSPWYRDVASFDGVTVYEIVGP